MATLSELEKQIATYDAQAPNIEQTLKKQVQEQFDYGKPWLENIATFQRGVLPSFYKYFANPQTGGTGAADLSPAAKMAAAAQEVSRMGALSDVAQGVYSKQVSREDEMIRNLLNAWNMARGTSVDAYNRQLQRDQLARSGSGSSSVPSITLPQWELEDTSTQQSRAVPVMSQSGYGGASTRASVPQTTKDILAGAGKTILSSIINSFNPFRKK